MQTPSQWLAGGTQERDLAYVGGTPTHDLKGHCVAAVAEATGGKVAPADGIKLKHGLPVLPRRRHTAHRGPGA